MLAWAAGFFDGEGWANASQRGVRTRINQSSSSGMPEVLIKFRRIVAVGRLKGPVIAEGRKPMYYWEATARHDVLCVANLIAPWLCPVKRAEFETTLRDEPAPPSAQATMSEELAWAAGFFDGEGSTYLLKHRTHANYFAPVVDVPQSSEVGIAVELTRFQAAVGGRGSISGPRQDTSTQKPYHRWRAGAKADVALILHLLWPFIGDVKRAQAIAVMKVAHSQPDLPRGNPAFGAAGSRYCLRGHDKWAARIRPYVSRGVGREDGYLHQCLVCMREQARERARRDA